jgi:DNA-binding CsgD family transcriptional regulator
VLGAGTELAVPRVCAHPATPIASRKKLTRRIYLSLSHGAKALLFVDGFHKRGLGLVQSPNPHPCLPTHVEPVVVDDAMVEAEREIHRLASTVESTSRRSGGLSDREAEIASLAADGLTNRQIARRLSISEQTAEAHLRHILDKLDLMNRTQLAGWVREMAAWSPS